MIINQYLTAIKIGIVVVVVVALGTMFLMLKTTKAEKNLAILNLKVVSEANESLKLSLDTERKQREQVEILLADRAKIQKELEISTAERLRKKNRELAALRKANEETDTYLSLPVPTAYLEWLRLQTSNKNGNSPYVSTNVVGPAIH